MTQFFTSGGQTIGVSASASALPMNIQDCFPLGWTGWISLQSKGLSRVFSLLQHHSSKASILLCSVFFMVQLSYPYMTTGEAIALTRWTFVSKIMSLLFNVPSRFVTAILPRSKCLFIVHGAHLSSNTHILGFPRVENCLTLKAFFLMITNSLQTLSWNCETPLGTFFFMVRSDQIRSDQSLSHVRLFATP